MKDSWNADVRDGLIEYDKHFQGWLFTCFDYGGCDEIFLGATEAEAYKTYCDIKEGN